MSISLDYQLVYNRKGSLVVPIYWQIAAALLLLVSLSLRIWVKIETTDAGYKLARERETTIALDMERRELELQLSVLMRPDNLAQEAQKRLGLGALKPGQARKVEF
ncbi:MAG: hypothetical protein GYA55_02095 [SAR324 cluster bacterium]|uniref:Cell division protein FtsL n=1 Tax=SAR324 cluster bacterium TaxID=2024889 RepID=A0A7X9FPP2_9DELT|nr:hypothetical protein [SAR324 cluster bacterium]